jgi:hypothetical protein
MASKKPTPEISVATSKPRGLKATWKPTSRNPSQSSSKVGLKRVSPNSDSEPPSKPDERFKIKCDAGVGSSDVEASDVEQKPAKLVTKAMQKKNKVNKLIRCTHFTNKYCPQTRLVSRRATPRP